jgi:amino acid transporter
MSSSRLGLSGLGAFTGALVAIGSLAGVYSWFGGAARVPFAAGVDRALPAAFARLDPKHGAPRTAILVQGLASVAIFLVSVFLSVTGGQTSIQEAYDIMVNLTILVYFVPYLYLFAALVRLRVLGESNGSDTNVWKVPGGTFGLWAAAISGFVATIISVLLVFVPPAGTENVVNYEANLIGQAAVVLGIGGTLYWFNARRS